MVFPNVRGSTGYGKTFVNLDNGMKREDSVKDIGALLDWIAQQPDLDAGRIMVTGGSYGGYMTLAVATSYNDRIACAVDIVGISNFNTFLKNTESYRRDLRRVEYGDERRAGDGGVLRAHGAAQQCGEDHETAVGRAGRQRPARPADRVGADGRARPENGTPVWYLMATDEGHGFAKKSNVDFQFYATVTFARTFLLSEPQR